MPTMNGTDAQVPAISVVIPMHNAARTIGQQLAALAAQRSVVPFEVVVSDNGSSDASAQVVGRLVAGFPVPLRLIDSGDRPGASHARNAGALAARSPVLAFCDADDVVFPDWVQVAHECAGQYPVTMGRNRRLEQPLNEQAEILNPNFFLGLGMVSCNFVIRRDTYFQVGGFNESLPRYGYEDTEFTLRLRQAGVEFGAADDLQIHFRRTVEPSRRLRKIYAAGYASMVAKAQHPEVFGPIRVRDAVRHLWRLPWDYRHVATRPGRHPVGELATRLGVLHACLTRIALGRIPDPIYVSDQPPAT